MKNSTFAEKQLVAQYKVIKSIIKKKHGGDATKGHVICFPQDVTELATVLPRLQSDIDVLQVASENIKTHKISMLRIRRCNVEEMLDYLIANHPGYKNIQKSMENLNKLPEDGFLETQDIIVEDEEDKPDGIAPEQTEPPVTDEEYITDEMVTRKPTVLDLEQEKLERVKKVVDQVEKTRQINWPERGSTPVPENSYQFLPMAFPWLFPNGKSGFNDNRPWTNKVTFLKYLAHLIRFKDGRFAADTTFGYVALDMLHRMKNKGQARVFCSQNLNEARITMEGLKKILEEQDPLIAHKILMFAANEKNSASFWFQKSLQLRSMVFHKVIQGKGVCSFFCTITMAEFKDPILHAHLNAYIRASGGQPMNFNEPKNVVKAIMAFPQVIMNYFQTRVEDFLVLMQKHYDLEDYWLRFEWTPGRGAIHAHWVGWTKGKKGHRILYIAMQLQKNKEETAEMFANYWKTHLDYSATLPKINEEAVPLTDDEKTAIVKEPLRHLSVDDFPRDSENKIIIPEDPESARLMKQKIALKTNKLWTKTGIHSCTENCKRELTEKQARRLGMKKGEIICRLQFPKKVIQRPLFCDPCVNSS